MRHQRLPLEQPLFGDAERPDPGVSTAGIVPSSRTCVEQQIVSVEIRRDPVIETAAARVFYPVQHFDGPSRLEDTPSTRRLQIFAGVSAIVVANGLVALAVLVSFDAVTGELRGLWILGLAAAIAVGLIAISTRLLLNRPHPAGGLFAPPTLIALGVMFAVLSAWGIGTQGVHQGSLTLAAMGIGGCTLGLRRLRAPPRPRG